MKKIKKVYKLFIIFCIISLYEITFCYADDNWTNTSSGWQWVSYESYELPAIAILPYEDSNGDVTYGGYIMKENGLCEQITNSTNYTDSDQCEEAIKNNRDLKIGAEEALAKLKLNTVITKGNSSSSTTNSSNSNSNSSSSNSNNGGSNTGLSLTGAIQPIKLFYTLDSINSSGDDWKYDWCAIAMSSKIDNYVGNASFLSNSDSIEDFSAKLKATSYDNVAYEGFIQELKTKFGISDVEIMQKDTMTYLEDENQARLKRNNIIKTGVVVQWMELVVRIIGIILIFYGILVILCGVVDEVGLVNKFMTKMVTFGHISQEVAETAVLGIGAKTFRWMYLGTGIIIILMGVFCLMSPLRKLVVDLFRLLVDKILYFFNYSSDLIDSAKESIGGN